MIYFLAGLWIGVCSGYVLAALLLGSSFREDLHAYREQQANLDAQRRESTRRRLEAELVGLHVHHASDTRSRLFS